MNKNAFFYCLSLVSLFFWSCEEDEVKNEEVPMETYREEVKPTIVSVGNSERKSFDYLINATGKIEAAEQLKIVVEKTGYLVELLVEEGQNVNAGDIIARLDNSETRFELEKAEVELRSAQAQYQDERAVRSSRYVDFGEDSLSLKDFDDLIKAKSGLLKAEIDIKEAKLNLEKSVIKAPISGTVADVMVKRGSMVNSGDEICELLSANNLTIKVKVLEADINYIRKGQKAEVEPVSGSQEGLLGTVSSINPKVDENGLVQVTVQLNQPGGLLPGMNARAVIRAPQNNSLVVPKPAVVYRSGRPVVFTIENGEAIWNYVEVGKDNGREMEILDGIAENTSVIISNNVQLGHQASVQILKD
ncbi:efflux RND transporter periplasmic adaptor subunit [Pleomorphovibrio marinus]|uniref:efflux RND transporter periplasmic adaptor subunit n=1 Tax=Pleomorphovibrio marinus TaxID=2164132 RepID=UPI000E0CB4E3|nr:efflux RND transporter periplasmic adaptor subunit [Pleomorphovibrio marinus]